MQKREEEVLVQAHPISALAKKPWADADEEEEAGCAEAG
jgi:hypothetical protein